MQRQSAIALLVYLSVSLTVTIAKAQPSPVNPLPHPATMPAPCPDEAQARAALQNNPKDSITQSNLGRVLVCRNQLDEALALHRAAIARNPKDSFAYQDLADVLVRLNRPDEAIAAFRQSLSLLGYPADQQEALAYEALGNILVDLNQPEAALAAYQKMVAAAPLSSWVVPTRRQASPYRKLGTALALHQRQEAALAAFQKAVTLDPIQPKATPSALDAQAYRELADALRQQGNLEAAKTAFETAIKLDPDYTESYRALGRLHLTLKQPDAAIAAYRALLKRNPQDKEALLQMAEILTEQNHLDEAKGLFHQVIAQHPLAQESIAPAHDGLGLIWMKQNKPTEAIAAFRKAIQLHPGYADAFGHLGDALVQQNQPDAAIAAYQPFLDLYKDAEVYNYFGNFLSRHKSLVPKAIAAYRKAIVLDANFTPAYIGLGKALTQQQQFDAAIQTYQKVINIMPSAAAYHGLAMALMGQNKRTEAIAALKQAIAVDSEHAAEAQQMLREVELLKKSP